ncbi:MAG: carbamate kinase [Myxococcales bacterium]|nr:MAG: carbamate kinase [Myxococcales bacterium]
MHTRRKVVVVALGGNSLTKKGQRGTIYEQFANTRASVRTLWHLIELGYQLVITHGNGPQVGDFLIQMESAIAQVPPQPLGVIGAATQGTIGYMIQQTLQNHLILEGRDTPVVTILTQVVVDRHDPLLVDPIKPIGATFYTEEEAKKRMTELGWSMKEDAGRGWRRVVPSPVPLEIVELDVLESLLNAGAIVITAGGGGIPVIIEKDGRYEGVDAVIDKDLASGLLARSLDADVLIMLTAVDRVALDYASGHPTWLDRMTAHEAKEYLAQGQFPQGSMGPKIEASVEYLLGVRHKQTRKAIITDHEHLRQAMTGKAGTTITFQ